MKYLLIFLFCALHFSAAAQQVAVARNTVFAEGHTDGPVYSINYDRISRFGKTFTNTWRIGFSVDKTVIALPLGYNFLKGDGAHHFEFGLTLIPLIEKYKYLFSAGNISDKKLYVVPGAGYRYQPPGGGLFLRLIAGPSLMLDPRSDNFWKMDTKISAGISAGAGISF